MLKQNNIALIILGSYGVAEDGTVHPGCCPEGVDGVNHPEGSGPLYTEEGRAALGVTEEPDPVRPDDMYHDVSGDAVSGYTAEPKPLATIAGVKLAAANGQCDALLARVKLGYPPSEVESWGKQESEARAWLAKNTAPTPLLNALAAGRGLDKAELVGRVIAKADAYAVVVGAVIGARQAIEDSVNAALSDTDEEAGRAALIAVDPMAGWPELQGA